MKRFVLPSTLAAIGLLSIGCNSNPKAAPDAAKPETSAPKATASAKPKLTKLEIKDTKVGKGKPAVKNTIVYVQYVGRFADGTEFDGSEKHNDEAFFFTLGHAQVIKGWDEGLLGMKPGGERDLAVPGALAYGTHPPKGFDQNADLYFHIKLLDSIAPGDQDLVLTTDKRIGSGRAAKDGDSVSVHYVGTLITGQQFDSSRERNQPLELKLGAHEVVPGFESGIVGMKVGGLRRIHIPPALGYGPAARPPIPPEAILNFDVELLSIK